MKNLVFGGLIALTATLMGCGNNPPSQRQVRDSPGVRIATYSGPVQLLGWSLDTLRTLGGRDDGPEGFYRVGRHLVDVDPVGRIYILDRSRHRAVVFDSGGSFLRAHGQEGRGPGEFEFPISISATDQGDVYVHDGAKYAALGFTATGDLLDRIPYPYSVINVGLRSREVVPAGTMMWSGGRFQGGSDAPKRLLRLQWIADTDTVDLIEPRDDWQSTARYARCGMTYTIKLPFSPWPRWSQWEERVAFNLWADYRVDVVENGTAVLSVRMDESTPEMDAEAAIRLLKDRGFVGGPCYADAREQIEKHGFHPRVQLVQDVTVEPSGRIWVEFVSVEGDRRIDVFDSKGNYEGSLADPYPMPIAFLPDGRSLLQLVDSMDVERLGVAEVVARSIEDPGRPFQLGMMLWGPGRAHG